VLAINKMDLVDYCQEVFERKELAYREFAGRLDLNDVVAIPISAVHGDNVVRTADTMTWYSGPTLLEHLEKVPVGDHISAGSFRMPVW
jgi:bifunctional enzyme CysN/CysC